MILRPPRSTPLYSSAASDVYKRQRSGWLWACPGGNPFIPFNARISAQRLDSAGMVLDDLRESGPLFTLAQIAVEHHADGAYQQASTRRDGNALVVDGDQSVLLKTAQCHEFFGEVTPEVDEVGNFDRFDADFEVAHQRLDQRAPHNVVGRELDAAEDRQFIIVETVIVIVKRAHILRIGRPDFADGRDAVGDQIAFGARRVALEITMQASLLAGDVQLVVGLG